jgi:tetratricopeptide (TPR) repeat protein
VSSSQATVEQLLHLLPGVDELETLRLAMIRTAVPDPGKAWDSSSSYATLDKRILAPEDVEQALAISESALHAYVTLLHDGLRPAFRSYFAGDHAQAATHLIALGERHEATGRVRGASQCYHAALILSLPLAEKASQIVALRRLGRVMLALGEFRDAISFYDRSVELARDAGDLRGEVIGRTGVGNVALYQGRWADSERAYLQALDLVKGADEGAFVLETGHLFNNLGNVNLRLSRFDEADEWLQRAFVLWSGVDAPEDLGTCYLNLGQLRAEQGRTGDARAAYEAAVGLPVSSALKSLLAGDLAELCLVAGHVTEAETLARMAEEHAIASSSPYTLGYMYRVRGNLARCRGHEDGFTFYEKALEIAREKGYPPLEADTLADYAELRRVTGGAEEAEAYLERAREIFDLLGAVQSSARVQRALDAMRTGIDVPLASVGH